MTKQEALILEKQYDSILERLIKPNFKLEKPTEKEIITSVEYGRFIFTKVRTYKNKTLIMNIYNEKDIAIYDRDVHLAEALNVSKPMVSKAFKKNAPKIKDYFIFNVWVADGEIVEKTPIYDELTMERFRRLRGNIYTRCYNEAFLEAHPTYRGCTMDVRWDDIETFVEDIKSVEGFDWWLANPNQRISLDKDILYPGNKHYSFDRVKFVSNVENSREAFSRMWEERGISKYGFTRESKLANLIIEILSGNTEDLTIEQTSKKYDISISLVSRARKFVRENNELTLEEFLNNI